MPMKKQPLVNIIILNWNGSDDTIECLHSIKDIGYKNYLIMLVDNGSSKDDIEKLENIVHGNSKIRLIKNGKNLGFAGGCNVALKISLNSKAKYSLLLNNDTIVDNNFLDSLVKVAEVNENTGIVGPKVYHYDQPKKMWTAAIKFNYYFPPLSSIKDVDHQVEVNDIVGAAMLIRNETLKNTGIFDEEYFAYGEESDLNYRILNQGYKLIYCPDSVVWHKISGSTGGGFNSTVAYYKMRNKIKYAKKNYSFKYWPTYLLFLILYFLKSQAKAIFSGNFKVSKALIKGVLDA
jgi:GT2 family glycosyltransferase